MVEIPPRLSRLRMTGFRNSAQQAACILTRHERLVRGGALGKTIALRKSRRLFFPHPSKKCGSQFYCHHPHTHHPHIHHTHKHIVKCVRDNNHHALWFYVDKTSATFGYTGSASTPTTTKSTGGLDRRAGQPFTDFAERIMVGAGLVSLLKGVVNVSRA